MAQSAARPSLALPRRAPLAALTLLLALALALASVTVAAPARASTADVADRIFALINAERVKRSLPQLQRITELDKVAQPWSNHQAATRTMAHNPSYSSQYPAGWQRASENVAYASSSIATGDKFMEMWMASEGHRNNILNPYITHAGIGVAATSSGDRLYATQNFAQYPSTVKFAAATPVQRISGSHRYATSVAISKATYAPGVPVVYLANGVSSIDALSAASAAGRDDSPVLLTPADQLLSITAAELDRLNPGRIVVLGTGSSVSSQVEQAARAYGPVSRISGPDRYATSAAVSAASFAPGARVVYIANGATYVDALSAAPVAGRDGAPVLLTKSGELPAPIAAELSRLRPGKIVVLGDTTAVSSAVETKLRTYAAVERRSGDNRYATSAALSKASFPAGLPVVYVANGQTYVDALSAAPVAGMKNAPVLLTTSGSVPPWILTELQRLNPGKIVILGDSTSISSAVADTLGRI
ncbi:cell wall-binding repeat-containing protein [Georgenia muralis]